MTVVNIDSSLSQRFERLQAVVADNLGWVAFSGGVDSTLLLKVASEVNSPPAVALFADSPLQSELDRDNVKNLAELLNVQLLMVPFNPLVWSEFTANLNDRCYLCKRAIYSRFQDLLPDGCTLLDGTNCDDLGTDRPGHRAIAELGVVSPLALAGFTKMEVRQLSRWLGLPNWNRPSSSCLATRIPLGLIITQRFLRRIEACESLLRSRGFGHIRVRLVKGRPDDLLVELAREEIDRPDFNLRQEEMVEDLKRIVGGEVEFSSRTGVL
ncbi:MAG: ATP-dependent sacrificial sulfur transferase LarE [Desulfobulbaceae bacterium]|nr:ATP-dependent sacrificial sulfur transferase LarE [Desulfobulbaceae bacterium]